MARLNPIGLLLVCAALFPGCLLTAISEEALTGGGPGDQALVPDAGAIDAVAIDHGLDRDRAGADHPANDAASWPDQPVFDLAGTDAVPRDGMPSDHGTLTDTQPADTPARDRGRLDAPAPDTQIGDAVTPDSLVSRDSTVSRDSAVADTSSRDTALRDLAMPDQSGRVLLFGDDFESGSISNWSLSGPGAQWYVTNLLPATGLYSARVRPLSSVDPASIMERAVSTVGRSTIRVEYDRKLAGLDADDEFRVSWYDGSSWNVLEATGPNPADGAYGHQNHLLPAAANNNAALVLRVDCTAEGNPEHCYLDNVMVWAGP